MWNQREASSHYNYPKIVFNNYLFINMTRKGKKYHHGYFSTCHHKFQNYDHLTCYDHSQVKLMYDSYVILFSWNISVAPSPSLFHCFDLLHKCVDLYPIYVQMRYVNAYTQLNHVTLHYWKWQSTWLCFLITNMSYVNITIDRGGGAMGSSVDPGTVICVILNPSCDRPKS